ncbi:MAG: DUF4920 domain-containing protein [Polyangiaceae bacterium]|nr:DUF4920 domain-containing protein [Polyangiaceae bacterium]
MQRSLLSLGLVAATVVLSACAQDPSAAPEPKATEAAAAQTQAPKTADTAGATASLAGKAFGDKITLNDDVELGSIVTDPTKFADQTVRTTGVVQAVCQKAGCWMEIGDAQSRAHIKMGGHAFLVPKSASGHRAVVQGTVKGGAPANECGSKDSCGGTDNGAIAKIEIVATGVEFVD